MKKSFLITLLLICFSPLAFGEVVPAPPIMLEESIQKNVALEVSESPMIKKEPVKTFLKEKSIFGKLSKIYELDKKLKGKKILRIEADSKEFECMPDEIIIKFKPSLSESEHSFLINKYSSKLIKRAYKRKDTVLIEAKGKDIFDLIEEMKKDPDIEYASPNYVVHSMEYTNNDYYYQWALYKIQAKKAWEITKGNDSVIVAIVDTGVNRFHEDLYVKWWGWDFVHGDDDPMDDNGHGTHVAGIIRATIDNGKGTAGVAPYASLLAIKVLDSSGSGTIYDVYDGMIYASDYADIINLSLGGYDGGWLYQYAVDYAHSAGDVVVAAAGNDNTSDKLYPAACTRAIAVASTNSSDQQSSFSNYGGWINVSAPGESIVSTTGSGYEYWYGTSMATPHVSGLAALIWSANRSLTNDQVKSIIEQTSDDLGSPGKDDYYGYGRVNAFKALKYVLNDTTPPSNPTISSSTHPNQSNWYSNKNPSFTFSATDANGVIGYSYILDQLSSTTPDTISEGKSTAKSYSNLGDGIWYFHVRAMDVVENWGNPSHYTVRIDSTPPNAPSPDDGIVSWSNSTSRTFSWTGVTDTAPVDGYYYGLDDSSTGNWVAGTSVTIDNIPDGTHTFYVKSHNSAGLSSSNGSHTCYVDTVAPSKPISLTASPSTWTKVNSFSINWANPADVSGILAGAYYKLDSPPTSNFDGTWTGNKPFTVSVPSQGVHTIYVWLKDGASNVNWENYETTNLYYDATPPGTPTDINIETPKTGAELVLSWTNPIDSDFSHIHIYRSEASQILGSLIYDNVGGTTKTDSGLTNGKTYYYTLRSVDIAQNESTNTNQVSGTPKDLIPPLEPSGVSIINTGLGGELLLSWTNPTDSDFSHIHIYRSTVQGDTGSLIYDNVGGASKFDQGLINGFSYFYTLRSVDTSGNESANINQISGIPTDIAPPSEFSLKEPKDQSYVGKEILFSWEMSTDKDLTCYDLYIDGALNKSVESNVTSTTLFLTLGGGSHEWYVVARDGSSNTRPSSEKWHILFDSVSPTITDVKINNINPKDGDPITPTPLIEATISDNINIDSNSIEIIIDEGKINQKVYSNLSSYFKSGKLSFRIEEPLGEGTHDIKIKAKDSCGNESSVVLKNMKVSASQKTRIEGIPLSYPNPFTSKTGTTISYYLTHDANVTIKVYDITGVLLWQKSFNAGEAIGGIGSGGACGYNEVHWSGYSAFGEMVGNGVYLFIVTADGKVISKGTIVKHE